MLLPYLCIKSKIDELQGHKVLPIIFYVFPMSTHVFPHMHLPATTYNFIFFFAKSFNNLKKTIFKAEDLIFKKLLSHLNTFY